MAGLQVQRNLLRDAGAKGPGDGALVRCPKCSTHFYSGGEVDDDAADGYQREREETDRFMDETDDYSGRGTDRSREAGFASGGKVDGIHRHPSECSYLADGGPCQHTAQDSGFARHLAQRRAARRSR